MKNKMGTKGKPTDRKVVGRTRRETNGKEREMTRR